MSGAVKGIHAALLVNEYNLGRFVKDGTVSAEATDLDTTAWSTGGDESSIPSYTRCTGTFSGLFTGSTGSTGSDDVLSSAFGSTSTVLTYGPEGTAVGKVAKMFRAVETQYNLSSPITDVVSFTAGVKGTTRYESGFFLKALAANTSTAASAAVDGSAATTKGGVAHLHVTAASTLTSYVAKVQHSSNSTGAWSDLITFTASTDVGVQRSTVAGSVKRYTRTAITTLTGGAGKTVTASVAFARHR